MSVQKGFRNNIKVYPVNTGPDKRLEMQKDITDGNTFLPQEVLIRDMDDAFMAFINNDLNVVLDGQKVPAHFYTIQRWSEFTKTWESSDKYKNIKLPMITVVRNPDVQDGTNQAGLWNIPGKKTYTYMKVPTWDGAVAGIDTYRIPQPTSVDLTYQVRLFTNRLKDLNHITEIIKSAFQSRQYYINVKGHPMPLHIESIGDESNIDDMDSRRYYIISFEMKLLGYILRKEEYEVLPSINRISGTIAVDEIKIGKFVSFDPMIKGNDITYSVVFKPSTDPQFTFIAPYSMSLTQLVNVVDITRIIIKVNDSVVFDGLVLNEPLTILSDSRVNIRVFKNFSKLGKFQLLGNTI